MSKDRITRQVRVQETSIDDFDQEDRFQLPNTYDTELLIMRLSDARLVQVLLWRYLGYDYTEITKLMELRNIGQFYFLWSKLKTEFEKLSDLEG